MAADGLIQRLIDAASEEWTGYTDHAFVRGMADGSLPQAAFRHYLAQDYLFLIHFARAYALAVYKGQSLADMRAAHAGLKAILDVEMDLHVGLCGSWGISPAELEAAPEAKATMAYTRYVLETGLRGDLLDLHVALAPCVIGYGEIARRIASLMLLV
jgi:thiaminase (transcriptional activator TenA)